MLEYDLNSLTLPELKNLNKTIEKAIAEYDSRKKLEARAALEAHAKGLGFSLAELTSVAVPKTRASASPKYRHPENELNTWSGRGRKPNWFLKALDEGKSPESMAI